MVFVELGPDDRTAVALLLFGLRELLNGRGTAQVSEGNLSRIFYRSAALQAIRASDCQLEILREAAILDVTQRSPLCNQYGQPHVMC